MTTKHQPTFDPKAFLAHVGKGRSIGNYHKDQIVFSQGDPADAVFYVQKGKVKVTVVSEQGKEAVVAMLGNYVEVRIMRSWPRRTWTAAVSASVSLT